MARPFVAAGSQVSTATPVGRLHVIVDTVDLAVAALAGGARTIQVRCKAGTDLDRLAVVEAVALRCAEAGAACIVNDRVDLALAVRAGWPDGAGRTTGAGRAKGTVRGAGTDEAGRGAGAERATGAGQSARTDWGAGAEGACRTAREDGSVGVHLGVDDLPVAFARQLLGPEAIVGGTARDPATARRLVDEGASYLGVGPVFATSSKNGLPDPLGLDRLAEVVAAVDVPVIAIAGITAARVTDVLATGAWGVAVIGAVAGAPDPTAATAALVAAIAASELVP